MVGDALLDIIFAPEENDGVGMLIGEPDQAHVSQTTAITVAVAVDITSNTSC